MSRPRRSAGSLGRALAGAAVALVLAGCGGGSSSEELSAAAAATLGKDVDAITVAARADDAARVQDQLLVLRRHVEQYQASKELSESRAAQILAAAARVATDVGAPEPEVVVSVAPAPSQDGKADDGKDEGKGDDRKGEDEKDGGGKDDEDD